MASHLRERGAVSTAAAVSCFVGNKAPLNPQNTIRPAEQAQLAISWRTQEST